MVTSISSKRKSSLPISPATSTPTSPKKSTSSIRKTFSYMLLPSDVKSSSNISTPKKAKTASNNNNTSNSNSTLFKVNSTSSHQFASVKNTNPFVLETKNTKKQNSLLTTTKSISITSDPIITSSNKKSSNTKKLSVPDTRPPIPPINLTTEIFKPPLPSFPAPALTKTSTTLASSESESDFKSSNSQIDSLTDNRKNNSSKIDTLTSKPVKKSKSESSTSSNKHQLPRSTSISITPNTQSRPPIPSTRSISLSINTSMSRQVSNHSSKSSSSHTGSKSTPTTPKSLSVSTKSSSKSPIRKSSTSLKPLTSLSKSKSELSIVKTASSSTKRTASNSSTKQQSNSRRASTTSTSTKQASSTKQAASSKSSSRQASSSKSSSRQATSNSTTTRHASSSSSASKHTLSNSHPKISTPASPKSAAQSLFSPPIPTRSASHPGIFYSSSMKDPAPILNKKHTSKSVVNIPTIKSTTTTTTKTFSQKTVHKYLKQRGYLAAKPLLNGTEVSISVATTAKQIFIPTVPLQADQYLSDVRGTHHRNFDTASEYDIEQADDDDGDTETIRSDVIVNDSDSLNNVPVNANGRTIKIDESMANYSFALVLTVQKQVKLSTIEVELLSRAKVFWNKGVPPSKTFKEEVYKVGSKKWSLTADNFNIYIPLDAEDKSEVVENFENIRDIELFKSIKKSDRLYGDKARSIRDLFNNIDKSKPQKLNPGYYIFVFPVVFSNHIPESFNLPSGRVDYMLSIGSKFLNPFRANDDTPFTRSSCNANSTATFHSLENIDKATKTVPKEVKKTNIFHRKNSKASIESSSSNSSNDTTIAELEDKSNLYAEYPLTVIRQPPSISVSTANRPIFIDRVWSDSLAYQVSFGKKFIPLNSRIPIKITLSPINKSIIVKRVRVSVVEKILFVSKNFEYQYNQVDIIKKDSSNPYYNEFNLKRKQERNLSLLEIRPKECGDSAVREEIIENCINDNIISYTGINKKRKNRRREKDEIECINDQWTIDTYLDFPKHEDLDKEKNKILSPYGIDRFIPTLGDPKKKVPKAKFKSGSNMHVKSHTLTNSPKRGLYVDSLNFGNITVKHKLELMLRLSKKEEKNGVTKSKNYEVLIDVPIVLVSELCDEGNMELPSYAAICKTYTKGVRVVHDDTTTDIDIEAPPPTFEEAISIPATPITSPMNTPVLTPSSEFGEDMYGFGLSRNNSVLSPSRGSSLFDSPPSVKTVRSTSMSRGSVVSSIQPNTPRTMPIFNRSESNFTPTLGQSLFKNGYAMTEKLATSRVLSDEEDVVTTSTPPGYNDVIAEVPPTEVQESTLYSTE